MINLKSQDEPALSSVNDAELIKQIQTKSPEECRREVEILYSRHSQDVYRMTKSLYEYNEEGIKNAEDLFQEAWRIAIYRIERYDPSLGRSFGAWVKGIADNLFLEDYKLNSKKEKAFNEIGYLTIVGDEGEPIDESQDLEKSVEVEEEEGLKLPQKKLIPKDDLLSALKVLTPTEKEILLEWLRTYDKNDPGNEVHANNLATLSKKFSLQKGSLRKIKQRALKKVQKYLGQ